MSLRVDLTTPELAAKRNNFDPLAEPLARCSIAQFAETRWDEVVAESKWKQGMMWKGGAGVPTGIDTGMHVRA